MWVLWARSIPMGAKKQNRLKGLLLTAFTCASFVAFTACGDDSSSPSPEEQLPVESVLETESSSSFSGADSLDSTSAVADSSLDSLATSDTTLVLDSLKSDTSLTSDTLEPDLAAAGDTLAFEKNPVCRVYHALIGRELSPLVKSPDGMAKSQPFGKPELACEMPWDSSTGCEFFETGIEASLDKVMLIGDSSAGTFELTAIGNVSGDVSIDLNFFTHIQAARTRDIMIKPTFFVSGDSVLQAALDASANEIWSAFGMGGSTLEKGDTAGAMFALHAMIYVGMLDKGVGFLDSVTVPLAATGSWGESSAPVTIADVLLLADATDGFAELRKKFSVPSGETANGFEKYLRAFYQHRLHLDACGPKNANKIFTIVSDFSRYAAGGADYSKVKERFMCDADGKVVFAPDSLKDVYGFDTGEAGEVRVGAFTENRFYTYDATAKAWRTATAVEKDSYFVQNSATETFADIQDVYESIKPNERVIFVLRHAERGDDTGKGGTLTSKGKNQSSDVGKKLTKFSEPFLLGASEFLRAHQTVEYIARGKGQQYDVRDTFPELNDDWYINDREENDKVKDACGGGWQSFSKYAYTGDYTTGDKPAFHLLADRSVELIEDVILAKYSDPAQRFVMLSSHDKVMVPLVAYCTNLKANLKYYDGGKWLNYLAGIAIIIDELGNRRYVPVKGLDSAYT